MGANLFQKAFLLYPFPVFRKDEISDQLLPKKPARITGGFNRPNSSRLI